MLARVAARQSTKLIADDLGISHKTVEFHRARITRKTGCRTLFELGWFWGIALREAAAKPAPARPEIAAAPVPANTNSIALRVALASVSAFGAITAARRVEESRLLPQIDHLTLQQLRERARDDREDAHAAVQRGSVATAAMLLNDAERCDALALALDAEFTSPIDRPNPAAGFEQS